MKLKDLNCEISLPSNRNVFDDSAAHMTLQSTAGVGNTKLTTKIRGRWAVFEELF